MNATLTPPPVQPPVVAATPTAPPRPASRVVSTVAIVVGAVVVAGTAGGILLGAMATGNRLSETLQASVDGVTSVDANFSAASVDIELGNVNEATLHVSGTNGADGWVFENRDGTLVVESPAGWSFGNWFSDVGQEVTLVLPARFGGELPDAAFTLNAGDLDLAGDFGALRVQLNAGQVDVEGTAESLILGVNAGGADVELAGVESAEFDLSAGSIDAELTGSAPAHVTIDVSAGTLGLTVPDAEYRVTSDVSAGNFSHDLRTSSSARHQVDVQLSAGTVNLESNG